MTAAEPDYWPTHEWRVSSPEAQGMDSTVLARMHAFGLDTDPPANGFVVVRHGYIVYEEYFHGFDRDSYQSVNSVTKSVLSMLVGIALGEGLLRSVDQPLAEFFPQADHRLRIK